MPGDGDRSTAVVDNEPQCVASRRRSAREFNDGGGGERIAASEAPSVEVGVDDLGTFEEKLDAASGPCGRNLDIPLVRSETHVGEAPRQVARETGCDGPSSRSGAIFSTSLPPMRPCVHRFSLRCPW